MQDNLADLNKKQREAVLHTEGPLLVVAGAGAGKTKTITHRIINLIKNGVPPEKILAVTFTNKAAKEMRERVQKLLNQVGEAIPFVSTFHSLGVHIIKENARMLGLTKHFTILDEEDSKGLIKEIIKETGEDPKQFPPGKIRAIISREKGDFVNYEEFAENTGNYFQDLVRRVWKIYEERKKKENSLDFDDLLLKTTELLQKNEEIRELYQDKWSHIHIDEYQDTNEVQYLLSKILSEKHKNICAVGDADQNIYSWRGANLRNILNFEKDYPEAKIVLLEENYRSTQNILEAANEVIRKNKYRPEKNLFTKNKTGEKIGLYEALDEADEADFVATKILELQDKPADVLWEGVSQADGPRGSAPRARGDSDPTKAVSASLSEIAVLYRANFQSRALEEAMLRYGIPYQVLGVKFFERKEIKDTLAYIRAALNRESLSDMKRIINFPARGIGKATLAKIFAGEIDTLPAKTKIKIENFHTVLDAIKEKIETEKTSEVIKFIIKKTGIETELKEGTEEDAERLENIKELATLALKYDGLANGKGTEKLLEDASLASDQDSLIFDKTYFRQGESLENLGELKKNNGVKLMTVHASKGLEFKYVFVVGLEDGLFPHRRDGEEAIDQEEERRLFYVAITRAKEKLFLSFANFRTIFGSRRINTPSEFIGDIPGNILEREGEQGGIKTIYI